MNQTYFTQLSFLVKLKLALNDFRSLLKKWKDKQNI